MATAAQTDFTPGPWKASVEKRPLPASGHWYVIQDAYENGLGEFYGSDHEENAANLRMAAAAPDMLEALESLAGHRDDGLMLSTRLDKARAAIAKARGEQVQA